MCKVVCIISILILSGLCYANAQTGLSDLDSILSIGSSQIKAETFNSNPTSIDWLFELNPEFSIQSTIDILEWQKDHYKSDLGLRFTASANLHFDNGFDGEPDNFDRYRVSFGIEWNMYENGWFSNHSKAQIRQNEAQILNLNRTNEEVSKAYGSQYNTIIYLFNKEKIAHLKWYLSILEPSLLVYHKYYLLHLMPYHEVLELKKRIEKYKMIIMDYEQFNREFEQTYGSQWTHKNSFQLTPMYINLSTLLKEDKIIEKQSMIRELENQNIYLKNRTNSDINVGVYARTNFTNGQVGGLNENYNTVGMRISVPIRSFYSHSKALTKLEVKTNDQRHQMMYKERKKELMVDYYEYEYNLQRYTELHYEHLKLKEKIRQRSVRAKLDSTRYSVIRKFSALLDYMDIGYEMIGVRQLLYLGMLRMQLKIPEEKITDFCNPLEFERSKKLTGNRIFRISSKDLQDYGHDFIANYLINNEVYQVLATELSAQQQDILRSYGVEFIPCIPDNTEVVPTTNFENRLSLESFIEQKATKNSFIYFDSFHEMITMEMKTLIKDQL